MSTDLEQRLREALHEDAQRARLVHPDAPPAPDARALGRVDDRPRSVRKLIAAAAVFALLAYAAAITLFDDDQGVDTGPPVTQPTTETSAPQPRPLPRQTVQALAGRTITSGSGCPFGISGEPVDLQPGPVSERFDTDPGQGVAFLVLGSQTAEVRVPGFEVGQPETWRIEPVDLGARSGSVWLDGPESASRSGESLPFVQVRYLPGGDEPCSSFSVTVDGGTEDANRATAVDLAERMLLPTDLEDLDLPGTEGGPVAGLELAGTTWGVSTPGSGPTEGARMSFTDTTVSWTDGCATVTASYELDRDEGFLLLSDVTSTDPGCAPPTHPEYDLGWPTISSVMGSDRVPAAFVQGQVFLGEYTCASCAGETVVLGSPP